MNPGDHIRQLRLAKNMTLEELGGRVGVGKSTVRKWETGAIANMRRDKIAKLAEALDTTVSDIMGIEEDRPLPSVYSDSLSPIELRLIADYRDASDEIREEAAAMLHRSAERNRKENSRRGSNAG